MNANHEKHPIVGVDIGGSHISACVVDTTTGSILPDSHVKMPVDASGQASDVLNIWAGTIKAAMEFHDLHIQNVGIAMPGPFDYDKGISYMQGQGKYDQLFGWPVKASLAEMLSIRPDGIKLSNDATCFLAGERKVGRAAGCGDVIAITLGTGLGSCRFRNEKEEEGDLWKFAYREGKAEDSISARWILSAYQQRTGEVVRDVKEMVEKSASDQAVVAIFEEFGLAIGEVIFLRYGREWPDKFVFTGGLTKSWELFSPAIKRVINEYGRPINIDVSEHQERAAMVGAALLWSDKYFMQTNVS